MRKIWKWIKDNAGPITVTVAILGGFAGIIQFSVVRPMQQGFDAVNQRIDDQIEYVNQRFDDQNRAINQRFDAVDQRFDDQDRYINQRFDAQDKYINQRFDAQDKYINQRFDAQDRRIEDLVNEVSEFRKLSVRVTRNETRIDALTEQLQTADAPSP
jgi:DNA anti-recombination protein RmuC